MAALCAHRSCVLARYDLLALTHRHPVANVLRVSWLQLLFDLLCAADFTQLSKRELFAVVAALAIGVGLTAGILLYAAG